MTPDTRALAYLTRMLAMQARLVADHRRQQAAIAGWIGL